MVDMLFGDSLSTEKKSLFVLILGSYSSRCLSEIEKLKNKLRSVGYENTHLVADLDDPEGMDPNLQIENSDLFAYKKSIHWLRQSHVNLFVFGKNCPYGSITAEMIITLLQFKRVKCSSFFFHECVDYESVPKGFLSEYDAIQTKYTDQDELEQLARNECWNHLIGGECTTPNETVLFVQRRN